MGQKNNVRRRKQQASAKDSKTNNYGDTSLTTQKASADQQQKGSEKKEEHWTTVVKRHPFTWGLALIGIPYGLHLLGRWILLQHPPMVLSDIGWIQEYSPVDIRPAVGLTDPRQVLILGSMSSGTSSMAKALQEELQLEIGHEDSDTVWKFVRDGTISWFHGIRYWPPSGNNETTSIPEQLCLVSWYFRVKRQNYGFGPTLFGAPAYNCSVVHPKFHTCHLHACHLAMEREYACERKQNGCVTPYQTTLLQTREPWKIVQSLVAKYCWKDGEIQAKAPTTLKKLLEALGMIKKTTSKKDEPKPSVEPKNGDGSDEFLAPSSVCVDQMLDYVVGYYNTILDAAPDMLMYKIESTSPCQVARMAGLLDAEMTVYQPNQQRIVALCEMQENDDTLLSSGDALPKPTNAINKGRVTKEDLLPYYSDTRLEEIQALYGRLGYEYEE